MAEIFIYYMYNLQLLGPPIRLGVFLCVVDSKIQFRSPVMVEVIFDYLQRFLKLRKGEDALKTALKQFKKRADNHLEEF